MSDLLMLALIVAGSQPRRFHGEHTEASLNELLRD
jgi:hypothetical protein